MNEMYEYLKEHAYVSRNKQSNYQFELSEERTKCIANKHNSLIKDLKQENKQLKDNWNELKEYVNKMHEYFLYTDVNEIYKQSMKEDNLFPNLFNLSELNASDRVLNSICKKIQELEQGSDKNV